MFVWMRKNFFFFFFFCSSFKILSKNFKDHHSWKLNKTYMVNMLFITLKDYFLEPKFLLCLNVHKLDDSVVLIWKKVLCCIFLFLCHILSFESLGLNWKFIRKEYGLKTNLKMSLVSSSDKSQPQIFVDFVIKIVLLAQIVSSESTFLELSILYLKPMLKL